MNKELIDILKKLPKLFFGFFLCSLGVSLMLHADLGMNPWGVFHKGLSIRTGITFGRASQITGMVIILAGAYLRMLPGFATLLNMFFIGYFIDLINESGFLSIPDSLLTQLSMLVCGMAVFSLGVYFYISCGLGAGPRDGLMLGLMKRFNKPVSTIRACLEGSALAIGFLLGGPVGIGTLIVAPFLGYFIQVVFKIARFNPKELAQRTLKDDFILITGKKTS